MTTLPVITPTAAQTAQKIATSALGKEDFLNLLITQMKNQDPLSPMDGTQYAAQLAQFSQLEQLSNLNDTTAQGVNANILLSESINNGLSATFIGKDVRAATNTFKYSGDNDVKIGYALPSAADTVTVTVYNEAGQVVKTMNGGTSAGENSLTWDGKNESGASAEAGKYTFKVEAKDSNGNVLTASQYIYGTVNSVRFTSNGAVFVIDGIEVPLSQVLEIMQG